MLTKLLRDAGGPNALRRAGWAVLIRSLPAIYGLGTLFTLIRFLPLEDYGRYGIAIAYINVAGVCSRGLWGVSLVRALPGNERAGVIGPVSWLSYSTAFFAALLALIVLPLLHLDFVSSLWVSGVVLATIPRMLGDALAQADARSIAATLINACYFLGSIAGFIVLATLGKLISVTAVVQVLFLASLVSGIVALFFYSELLRIRFHGAWRKVLSYGQWTGAQAIGEIYLNQGDVLLIGALVDPVRLAPYVAARALIRLYLVLSQAATFIVLPVAAQLSAAGEFAKLRKKLRSALLSMWSLLLPLNLVLFFVADWLIPGVLGEKYLAAVPFFKIIIGVTFLEPIYAILSNAFLGVGRAKLVAIIVWAALLLNALGNLAFVSLYNMAAVPWILIATYLLLGASLFGNARRALSA